MPISGTCDKAVFGPASLFALAYSGLGARSAQWRAHNHLDNCAGPPTSVRAARAHKYCFARRYDCAPHLCDASGQDDSARNGARFMSQSQSESDAGQRLARPTTASAKRAPIWPRCAANFRATRPPSHRRRAIGRKTNPSARIDAARFKCHSNANSFARRYSHLAADGLLQRIFIVYAQVTANSALCSLCYVLLCSLLIRNDPSAPFGPIRILFVQSNGIHSDGLQRWPNESSASRCE